MSAPLLEIGDLRVKYGRITALSGIDLTVHKGEIVAIVGPNGAGKSSLMNAVAGVVRASGSVRFDGEDVLGQPLERTVRRGIALVPEGRHVFAGLTVVENLKLGASIEPRRKVVEAGMEEFFSLFPILAERRHQAAGKLSGGEQQMLVIARALMSRPRLLMLDEPSLGLAPLITDRVYETVAAIRSRGVTVLVIEQNAPRALKIADRTYVLNGGLVRLQGPSRELAAHPEFEAAYFGLGDARPQDALP